MNAPLPESPPGSGDSIETRLRAAAPAPLPSALMARLRQANPGVLTDPDIPEQPRRILLFPSWKRLAMAAAAAAIAVLGGWLLYDRPARDAAPITQSGTDSAAAPSIPEPKEMLAFYPALESRQHLLEVKDLGVVHDNRQRAVRLVSTTWLDENTYGQPGSDSNLNESRYREEIVPVVLPVY